MNSTLYNLIVYIMISLHGTPRLDKKQNEIRQTLILIGFIALFILAIIGLVAICFLIKPPEYYSTTLA